MNRRLALCPLLSCLSLFVLAGVSQAENWPQWRGPRLDGVSLEKNIPTTWTKTENVAWRMPLPGAAGSTPIIWGDQIFLTSVESQPGGTDTLVLICLGTDGKLRWKKQVSQGNNVVRGDEGNSASPSPCTDGQHVWAMFSDGALACFDFSGKEIWKLDLQEKFGKFKIQFGMTSTPVLDGDRLYVQLIHGDGNPTTREATIAALDKLTGKTIWQTGRPSEAHTENEHSYASPTIYRDAERAYLLTHGADYVVAHDLNDGHELWRCGGLHPPARYDPTLRFVSSPLAVPGMILVPSAKKGITLALRPDGSGNLTDDPQAILWKFDITPDVPSPLIVGDIVYLCRENGNLIALDRATGKRFYEERTSPGRHRASPVYVDGKILLTSRDGAISVCEPGPTFKLLATNKMDEQISASPAVAGGTLYIRTFDALYAIRK